MERSTGSMSATRSKPVTRQAMSSPAVLRAATRISVLLASDLTLAGDEVRLAAVISDELRACSSMASIPSCLRDDA